AWMARILARFTPEKVATLGRLGRFSDPGNTEYLTTVLEGRLERILERYLTRLSPLASVHVAGTDRLCAEDLAATRHLRPDSSFRYEARLPDGAVLPVARQTGTADVCVSLPHAPPLAGDASRERTLRVTITDGVARGPLVAHLYDLGPAGGFHLVGLERPEP
ncbi:MAG TPA: hypothetical protein VIY73_09775, partial [Polyangiaceae bacterium]